MTNPTSISIDSINRSYKRVQNKLDELRIPYFVLSDSLSIAVPIDKLPIIKQLLEKENKYMEYQIKG